MIRENGIGFDVNGFNTIEKLLLPVSTWSENEIYPTSINELENDIKKS